jgi:hypothetical protein
VKSEPSALDQVEIASPCHASWEQMAGNDRVRFCDHCSLNVYNLSAMTRRQAEDLIQQRQGRLCVRLYRRRDGTVLTENCPVGWRAARLRVKMFAGGIASLVALLFGGRAFNGRASNVESHPAMGEMRVAPPASPAGLTDVNPPRATMGDVWAPTMGIPGVREARTRPPQGRRAHRR